MPSRKKSRGKLRKEKTPVARSPAAGQMFRELMAEGCRIIKGEDGSTIVTHPCFKELKAEEPFDRRNFDRGLMTDEQKQELADNYVHNFAQDLREGRFEGTHIIAMNITDPHIGDNLKHELLNVNIQLDILRFLKRADKPVTSMIRGKCATGESIRLTSFWGGILRLLVDYNSNSDEFLLAVAKDMKPFVMTMIDDDKRELFCSNLVWHVNISQLFDIARGVMLSKEAFLVMISYEGFLPFAAQASGWSQSREDIVAERRLHQRRCPTGFDFPPISIHTVCNEAQRILCLVLHTHRDVLEEDVLRGARNQIARTPLSRNDTNCNESTVVGLIRMMNEKSDEHDRELLFVCIVETLLLEHDYVDARVIAELIEYGKANLSSLEATETLLNTMVSILGQDDAHDHNELVDNRYAVAIRHGLLELCIDAVISYGDASDREIGEDMSCIAYGLRIMAMHSKTARALRERKGGIVAALGTLRKKYASQFDDECALINYSVEASSPSTCCNCLKEVDRKDLLFCKRCGVECYCSAECQSESYGLGHEKTCKGEVEFIDRLRDDGLSETELRRIVVLKSNLMMNGCRLVRKKAAEFLDEERNVAEVEICFGQYPPFVELFPNKPGESSGSLKCIFFGPVYYGFADRVDLEDIALEKVITRRMLAEFGSGTSDYDGVD